MGADHDTESASAGTERRGRARWDAKWVVPATCVYCVVFLTRVPPAWGRSLRAAVDWPKQVVLTPLRRAMDSLGVPSPDIVAQACYLALFAAILPLGFMIAAGRGRSRDLGLRLPNRLGWRVIVVGYAASLPFLIWMVRSPAFAGQYMPLLRASAGAFITFYLVNILSEHFLFHGWMLAAFRRDGRWPDGAGQVESSRYRFGRALQWIGFAQPVRGAAGLTRITRWLGLPDGCVTAVAVSGLLFGMVHLGKDPRELALSPIGGVVLAYLAYRTNSWLTPLILHSATAGTACLLMLRAGS